jgi:hypothetical protein
MNDMTARFVSLRTAAIAAALAALALTPTSHARKVVAGPALAAATNACMTADDARYLKNSTHTACCSKEAGICVVCPIDPNPENSCVVVNYRTGGIPNATIVPPEALQGFQMQLRSAVARSQAAASAAPSAAAPSAVAPTGAPKQPSAPAAPATVAPPKK